MGGGCHVRDLICVIGHPGPFVLLGAHPRGMFQCFFSGVAAPPFTPKEAREDLRPTDSGCQHNIMFKSVSLESRGS